MEHYETTVKQWNTIMEHCDTRVELYESTVEHFDTIVEVLTQQWSTVSKTMMHTYNTIEQ